MADARPTSAASTTRATVGRDALIPPDLAAAGTPAGGYGIRPYGQRQNAAANRETTNPAIPQTNVGDDACIVPETPRRRKVPREGHGPPLQTMENAAANRCGLDHPGDRRAGCPHPAGLCGGGNVCGRDKSLPYKPRRARGQPGNRNLRVIINLCRGRCLHRPGDPAPPQGPAGGPRPSPTNHGKCRGQPVRPRPPGRP